MQRPPRLKLKQKPVPKYPGSTPGKKKLTPAKERRRDVYANALPESDGKFYLPDGISPMAIRIRERCPGEQFISLPQVSNNPSFEKIVNWLGMQPMQITEVMELLKINKFQRYGNSFDVPKSDNDLFHPMYRLPPHLSDLGADEYASTSSINTFTQLITWRRSARYATLADFIDGFGSVRLRRHRHNLIGRDFNEKATTVWIMNFVIEGVHAGPMLDTSRLEDAAKSNDMEDITVEQLDGDIRLLSFKRGQRKFFLPGLITTSEQKAILRHHLGKGMSQEDYAREWVKSVATDLDASIKSEEESIKHHQGLLQDAAVKCSRLKIMRSAISKSAIDFVKTMVDEFASAGFVSHSLHDYGIVFRTGDVTISIGGHDSEQDVWYLGDFEVIVGLEKAIVIRNMASPKRESCHPIFDDDDCLGGYGDILRNCFVAQDYQTMGATLIAMLRHFSPSYNDYLGKDKWPSERPATTYVSPFMTIFGSDTNLQARVELFADDTNSRKRFHDDDEEEGDDDDD